MVRMCEHCGKPTPPGTRGRVRRFCDKRCISLWRHARDRAAKPPVEIIECGCGCGATMARYDKNHVERRYLLGHNGRKRGNVLACETCGREYPKRHRGARFCSRDCSGAARALAKVDLVCLVCGNDYPVHPFRAETSKYCSKECWSHRKPAVNCLACGVEFVPRNGSTGKYCSRRCSHAHMIGERAVMWKGGATLANERARRSADLRKWRLAVYSRDGYRCQDCGTRNELHAHHIKYWSTHPELRFDIDNGRTLCIDCHGKTHGRNLRKFRRKTLAQPPAPVPATESRPRTWQLALFDLPSVG